MQVLKTTLPIAATLLALASLPGSANAECEQVCFGSLPCQVTEIIGDYSVNADVCAGELVLRNGSRMVVSGASPRLISVERTMKVDGNAQIATQSSLSAMAKPAQAKSGEGGTGHARGPGTDGPGDAGQGASGENGENGTDGVSGQDGASSPELIIRIGGFSGGALTISARGGEGQDGHDGGDGGRGGDGQQGGRAIPGQPFGCRSGPGHGGNGGRGGNAGRGGNGGNGGNGGAVTFDVGSNELQQMQALIGKQILVDVQKGSHGAAGKAGSPGSGGLFGYGGRGATGCEGREEERKGSNGPNGALADDGKDGHDGQPGKVLFSERK